MAPQATRHRDDRRGQRHGDDRRGDLRCGDRGRRRHADGDGTAHNLPDADADEDEFVAQASAQGLYGSFALDASGGWSYAADNSQAAIQSLGAGETLEDSFRRNLADGTASQTVTVTINGVNDAATIGGVTSGAVTEDDDVTLSAMGQLTISDADAGEDVFAEQASAQGLYGTFTLEASGLWTYDADNTQAAIQSLGAGETLEDSFAATSADGTASQTVTVTIDGVNDAATIGGVTSGTVTEDHDVTLTAMGQLTISTPDAGEDEFVAQAAAQGLYGSFALDASGGWSYAADNSQAAIQSLGAGETLEDSFTAASQDGSADQVVTVTITGVNDQPTGITLSNDTVPENVPNAAIGTLAAVDVDSGDSFTYSIRPGGNAAAFAISGNQLLLGAAAADYEVMPELTVTVRATDAQGAFFDRIFTISVLDSAETTLGTSNDTVLPGPENTQVLANQQTLNPGDSLDAGGGHDELVLYGTGVFNLNNLAQFVELRGGQAVRSRRIAAGPVPAERHDAGRQHERQRDEPDLPAGHGQRIEHHQFFG